MTVPVSLMHAKHRLAGYSGLKGMEAQQSNSQCQPSLQQGDDGIVEGVDSPPGVAGLILERKRHLRGVLQPQQPSIQQATVIPLYLSSQTTQISACVWPFSVALRQASERESDEQACEDMKASQSCQHNDALQQGHASACRHVHTLL